MVDVVVVVDVVIVGRLVGPALVIQVNPELFPPLGVSRCCSGYVIVSGGGAGGAEQSHAALGAL